MVWVILVTLYESDVHSQHTFQSLQWLLGDEGLDSNSEQKRKHILPGIVSCVTSMLPVVENVVKPFHAILVEKTHLAYEAAQASSGIGTTRKSSKEDAIMRCIVVSKKSIGFTYVLREAYTHTTSCDMIPSPNASPDTSLVIDDLRVAMTVFRFDGSGEPRDV